MNIYTTCHVCQLILNVVDVNWASHPNCPDNTTDELADACMAAVLAGDNDTATSLGAILDRPTTPRLGAAALAYAAWGWPVFPLRPGQKIPATQRGFKDATTDPDRIREWWTQTPRANVGLPTGIHFDVIDVDAPIGYPSYHHMQDSDALPDIHGMSSTAGAGLHLLVQPTGEGNRAGMLPGIDYRGVGGYIVAPPSTTADGRQYLWRHKPSPIIKNTAA